MTHQEITHDQVAKLAAETLGQVLRLADFIHAIRADWDTPGIVTALRTANLRVGVTPADLGIAAIKAATNPKNRTPAVIPLDGDHWREHNRPPATPMPAPKCKTCGKWHDHTFACPGPTQPSTNRGEDLRAELFAAKARLCPHGVPWRACHQHDGHVVAGEVVNKEAG